MILGKPFSELNFAELLGMPQKIRRTKKTNALNFLKKPITLHNLILGDGRQHQVLGKITTYFHLWTSFIRIPQIKQISALKGTINQ